jgi:anti-sigma B factor antagonist
MALNGTQVQVYPGHAGHVTVRLHGEIDFALADDLRGAAEDIARHAPRSVLVDLRSVSFFDSTGVSFLVRLRRQPTTPAVVLKDPTPQIRRVLTLIGLDGLFPVTAVSAGAAHRRSTPQRGLADTLPVRES